MNKKVALSVLSATVFASMAASAFAAPKSGLYIGGNVDKYYSMNTLLGGMSSSALDQFSTEIGSAGFSNLIYVDFDGKGASIAEIMSATDFDSAKKDLTADKFEGVYSNITTDGSADGTYDPRNDAIDTPTGDLKVESVSAINLKQVEIKFNKELDSATAEDEDLYFENGVALSTVDSGATAELKDDNKTVIITYSAAKAKNSSFAISVDGVEDTDGNAVESDPFNVTFADVTKPSVTKTEVVAGDVVVSFAEPLKTLPTTFRVNGQPVQAGTIAFADANHTQVQATPATAIQAGTTASVYVAGATDFADLSMDLFNGSVTAPQADTTKPAVTSVTQVAQNKVRVVFSEKLDAGNDFLSGDVKVLKGTTVYSNGTNNASITVAPYAGDKTGKSYDVTIDLDTTVAGDNIFATGSSSQALSFLFDAGVVADSSANTNDEYTATVTLTRDATPPTFVSSKVATDKKSLNVTFSEDITLVSDAGIIVTDANGVRFPLATGETAVGTGTETAVLKVDVSTGTATLAEGTYTVKVPAGAVQDAQGNLNADVTTTITVGTPADTTKPVATITDSGTNKFQVAYGEEVTSSALSISNYKLDGVALPAGTDIYFTSSAKDTVEIVLPAGGVNIGKVGTGTTAVLSVSGVADKAGNVVLNTSGDVTVEDNTAAVLQSAVLIGDTLQLTFNENIDTTYAPADLADVLADFEIKAGSTALTAGTTGVVVVPSVSNNKVVLTVTAGDSNWNTVKAGTMTVKTVAAPAALEDANDFDVKGGVQVTVTKQ
ncbi:hypothetical protein [Brevibacillus centrosporus]|uniref:hypothetical protein n=1 Tax=Brevibacillus centrosporus TaxID=54910 RepID=UPI003B01023E